MKPEAISVSVKIRIVICLLIISLSVSMTGPVCLRAEAIDLNGFGPGDLMRDSGGMNQMGGTGYSADTGYSQNRMQTVFGAPDLSAQQDAPSEIHITWTEETARFIDNVESNNTPVLNGDTILPGQKYFVSVKPNGILVKNSSIRFAYQPYGGGIITSPLQKETSTQYSFMIPEEGVVSDVELVIDATQTIIDPQQPDSSPEIRLTWSETSEQYLDTVTINGRSVAKNSSISPGQEIFVAVKPGDYDTTKCAARYERRSHETVETYEENLQQISPVFYRLTVPTDGVLSNVELVITVTAKEQSSTQPISLIWSADTERYIDSVQSMGQVLPKGSAVVPGQEILVSLKLNGLALSKCAAEYDYRPYDSIISYEENLTQVSETAYRFVVPDKQIFSDIELIITATNQYPVWIAGTQVTDVNRDNVLEEQGYAVSFNPERNMLFLNNAVINGGITAKIPLTVVFSGDNIVSGVPGTNFGIYSEADLTLSSYAATDTLTVTAPWADDSCAIAVKNASLRIGSDANVTALSQGGTTYSTGVYCSGSVEVGGMLSASAGSAASSCGIRCNSLTVKTINSLTGGTVTASGGDCYSGGDSTGVWASGDVGVEYLTTLTVSGRGAAGSSRGVYAGGNFTNNGTADCTAGNSGSDSTGLYAEGTLTNAGMLTASGGVASETSHGIVSSALFLTGGEVTARAASGGSGSTGISGEVTVSGGTVLAEGSDGAFSAMPNFSGYTPLIRISDLSADAVEADSSIAANYLKRYVFITSRVVAASSEDLVITVGETRTLTASVPAGYTLRWYSSNSYVAFVDELLGIVTGRSPGMAVLTLKAYNPATAQTSETTCRVLVKENEKIVASVLHIDQEYVHLEPPGFRTVRYWFTPSSTTERTVTITSSDTMRNIIRVDYGTTEGEFYITPLGDGEAMITLEAAGGAKAYCKVTVTGMRPDTYYSISYKENDGVWYYDYSDGFLIRTTAPANIVPEIKIDGTAIPQYNGGGYNWTMSSAEGGTAIHFTKAFMASLYRGKHTLSISYVPKSEPIYIQSRRDVPKTGDHSLLPAMGSFLTSGCALAGLLPVLGNKKNRKTGKHSLTENERTGEQHGI